VPTKKISRGKRCSANVQYGGRLPGTSVLTQKGKTGKKKRNKRELPKAQKKKGGERGGPWKKGKKKRKTAFGKKEKKTLDTRNLKGEPSGGGSEASTLQEKKKTPLQGSLAKKKGREGEEGKG